MNSKELQIEEMITPSVEALSLTIWGVEFIASGRHSLLRIYINKAEGVIDVDDCAAASHAISAILDVEDPISTEYTLEVSSPGLDCLLFHAAQYEAFVGEFLEVRLNQSLDARRKFKGKIISVNDDVVTLETEFNSEFSVPLSFIDKARVVPDFTSIKK